MSSLSTTPPSPDAQAQVVEAPQRSIFEEIGDWLRHLSVTVKLAFVVLLVVLAIVIYIYTGRVTTDDAQIDCHITAVAPQVPGYVIKLLINDNNQ